MKPERWQQVEQLYHAALEREANQRAAFLAEACAGDDELRHEVESLLGHEAQVESFIEAPAVEVATRVMKDHQEDSLVGRMIGSWRILSLLGAGGMGQVYLAQDTKLGRKVALKLLPAEFTQDAERVRRFRLEARAASSLNHPNIITIHEIGEVGDAHFIVTEYVEGETLRVQISRAPLNRMKLSAVLDLAAQIASALAAAHEAGIVHRDIKPENVMVRRDGYVKVLDFGLAKLMEPAAPFVETEAPTLAVISTEAGVVMGTPRYMSPEQARGQKVDARTDIFSLGVMLYEMIAGRPPFEGTTPGDVIAAILTTDPAELSRHLPEVPSELERLVGKALQKDREERYQTVRELLADLTNIRQKPEAGTKMERADRGESAAAAPVTSSAEYLLSEIKRHKRGVFLVLTALVVAGAVIVWWLSQLIGRQSVTSSPVLKITRLTHTGKAVQAAVSPDGKYVVYAKDEAGRQSLWLIQVATASDEQILPSAEASYRGLTFSRDGNFIYYVRDEQNASTGTLYRKPVLGGAERKLLFNVDGPVALSPDDRQLAFVRVTPSYSESALMIANVDGAEERKLAVRKFPRQFSASGSAWSPDGKLIACGVLNFAESSGNVALVRVADGSEQSPGSRQWPISEVRAGTVSNRGTHWGRLAWNADGSALFMTIHEQTGGEPQIWRLSWPEGEAHKLTADLSGYDDVTLTAGSDTLVAVRIDQIINLQVIPNGDPSRIHQLTSGAGRLDGVRGLDWTPDGWIVYRSIAGGGPQVWITAADGTAHKQLTVAARNNIDPSVSPDGRYIVWGVNRTGVSNIWRMELDGSNAKQMTSGSGEMFPQYSLDGNWLVYRTYSFGAANGLWKAPLDGGAPVRLIDDMGWLPTLSPDGKLIACHYRNAANTRWQMALIPFAGGPPGFIEFLDPSYQLPVRWMPAGRALSFPVIRGGVSNLWSQPLDAGPPRQLTDFKDQIIFNFAWSRDGKQLALSRGMVNSDVVLIKNFK